MMRDVHVEKFLLLPFSIGCDSKSSVATATAATTTSDATVATTPPHTHRHPKHSEQKDEGTKPSRPRSKKNMGVSRGLYKLIKRLLRRVSKLFEGIDEPIEKELEIGFPTDVKHVTHIGLDGCTKMNNTTFTSEINDTQFPSISLEQFKMAMAAQTSTTKEKELVSSSTSTVDSGH